MLQVVELEDEVALFLQIRDVASALSLVLCHLLHLGVEHFLDLSLAVGDHVTQVVADDEFLSLLDGFVEALLVLLEHLHGLQLDLLVRSEELLRTHFVDAFVSIQLESFLEVARVRLFHLGNGFLQLVFLFLLLGSLMVRVLPRQSRNVDLFFALRVALVNDDAVARELDLRELAVVEIHELDALRL